MNATQRRGHPPNSYNRSGVMAVRTGLSKTIAGHIIDLDRDEQTKTARIKVRPMTASTASPTAVEAAAIKTGAAMLAQQARRFFGYGWTIHDWEQ